MEKGIKEDVERKSSLKDFNFLKQLQQLIDFDKEKSILSGENFNIFSIMSMESDEVFTHSALITELLDPKGSHGMGSDFLIAFYRIVLQKEFTLKIEEVVCVKEEHIGFRNEDQTSGGRLDIVLKDFQQNGFVIENKIYAGEQVNQLLRYKNKYPNAKLLYLTLYGESSKQVSSDGVEYTSISYENDIKYWIEECTKLSFNKPIIRETLQQYSNLIKKLTHQTSNKEMKEKVIEIINENFEASQEIYNNFLAALRLKQLELLNFTSEKFNEEMIKNLWGDISSNVNKKKDLDVLEINFKNEVHIQFRIKNLKDPLFLIGLTNKELDSKYSNALNTQFGFKNVDWRTDEWVLFKHDCQNFGQTNFKDDRQVLEYVIKIIQCFNSLENK
ncbi:PDDEXK-like family protein [Chryseobacterium turcicum]|uniref:PD-(D/E)XK nuclease family protein n=1 Tax=Chryseobacterium turcicum TaxID=2898076 RepID=A0A9Q3YXK8_9FLAO|nr:PD-(D/E)XK nuclease family protein [Chryseobacterium turcicum]MCD1119114.1 PD-(D/E)XK nuclease family protein [Chryseobacterium turcicum]